MTNADPIIWHTQRAACVKRDEPCEYCEAATTVHAQVHYGFNFVAVCDRCLMVLVLAHGRPLVEQPV